jgi:4-aminobutyrate aminotransferase-like enzyme
MMGFTGVGTWKLGPPEAGVVHAHSPYCYRCPFGLSHPSCGVRCATDVEELIRTTTSGRVAAFIGEPIQGVGGFITPPEEYFAIVAGIVRRHGGLFISDEVQTGWGRTGRWFGIEQWGVKPDILVSAKGLGNGVPVGVTVVTEEVARSVPTMTISTFGGGPMAATAAKAVIDFIDENRLLENAARAGAHLRASLEELQSRHALIGDVRGMGLMQALEFVRNRTTKEPASLETAQLMEACRQNGILVGKGGMAGNCIRLSPPLNISVDEIDEFCRRLDRALQEVEGTK